MANELTSLHIQSTITRAGELDLRLVSSTLSTPVNDEILVQMEAVPINPSDVRGALLGPADIATLEVHKENQLPIIRAQMPAGAMQLTSVVERLDRPIAAGNEGAGVVIDAGPAPEAQALIGKTVGIMGQTCSQLRIIRARDALVFPDDVAPSDAASHFVNPMTALSMIETMRLEGHQALIHTAAASNLGQILVRACQNEGVELVCIVRKKEQEALLKSLGAKFVVNSSAEDFFDKLVAAVYETNATIAFDAVGGGMLAHHMLTAIEIAQSRKPGVQTGTYGTNVNKKIYRYGGLDKTPTMLQFSYGMCWSVEGYLVGSALNRIGPERTQALRKKVAAEIKTTFASSYNQEISLLEMLSPAVINNFTTLATGKKYLVNPNKDIIYQLTDA